MIITLKGANFSVSNIGTLSTWRITRSLGTGAAYEGATSVDKGASYSATVTIADGYELGTAGVTVTMGGTTLSDVVTISENVITITITEVTGNVVIKVPTVNTSTGEEDDSEDNDYEDITSLFNFNVNGSCWLRSATGEIATTTDNTYTVSDYTNIDTYNSLELTWVHGTNASSPNGLCFYDSNKSYISGYRLGYDESGYSIKTITVDIPSNAVYVRIPWISTGHELAGEGYEFKCIGHLNL